MEKRVRFKSRWLPWLLIAPQMAIVLVFFFWPAGQALYQSVLTQDPFGGSTQFVGLENFERLFGDETYLASFQTTAFFSAPHTCLPRFLFDFGTGPKASGRSHSISLPRIADWSLGGTRSGFLPGPAANAAMETAKNAATVNTAIILFIFILCSFRLKRLLKIQRRSLSFLLFYTRTG